MCKCVHRTPGDFASSVYRECASRRASGARVPEDAGYIYIYIERANREFSCGSLGNRSQAVAGDDYLLFLFIGS